MQLGKVTATIEATAIGVEDLVTATANVAGKYILEVDTTAGITVGDIVTTYRAVGNISATSSVGNKITLSSTSGLNLNEKIVIKGATIGNLSAGTYYIKTIVGNDITISNTVDGATLIQVNAAGSMAFGAHNVFALDTAVTQVISSTDVRLNQILYSDIGDNSAVTFTRNLAEPTDCIIYTNGIVELTEPLETGTTLNISSLLEPARIDDVNYGTEGQTNTNAVMTTWVSDGISKVVEIPESFVVSAGDQFILRKSTSDGSIAPLDKDYDTALTGGDLAYSTATGLAADDIIVDGDGFVTPMTSSAPEEVVPGQVVDAVAIKVYDRPLTASANIKVDNYHGDGVTTEFSISQLPNSKQAVIVKITSRGMD